jgi:hypothetical protein
MNKVALISPNGEANNIVSTHVDSMYQYGVDYGGLLAKHLSPNDNDDTYISYKYWDFDTSTWNDRSPRPAGYYKWENNAWQLDSVALFSELRQFRDLYLMQSDWTQIADSPLTEEKKAEWNTYRAALRNVPAANSEATGLESINWPTPPE